MRWGREKPKGFIDDVQSYPVVSDVHAKLRRVELTEFKSGIPVIAKSTDERAVL
jgi:hypothetical protein